MAACCHAPPALFAALDLLTKTAQDQRVVPRMTPRRIVAVGILLLAVSGLGFAVVEAMRPPNSDEHAVMVRLAIQRMDGQITEEERDRQVDALDLGICGWMLRPAAYRNCRVLVFCGALAGLALIAAGAIRARQRSVATPPGS